MTLNPLTLSNLLLGLAIWGAAFLAALWLSLIIWTYRDIRSRTRDILIRFLAVVVVALLFLPGILVYLILRPPHTIEEEYQQTLDEEALLSAIEDKPTCPGCGRRIQETWTICPNCHTKLKKPCHRCGKLMELPWNLCPYCGAPAPGMRKENLTMEEALRSIPAEPVEVAEEPVKIEPVADTENQPSVD